MSQMLRTDIGKSAYGGVKTIRVFQKTRMLLIFKSLKKVTEVIKNNLSVTFSLIYRCNLPCSDALHSLLVAIEHTTSAFASFEITRSVHTRASFCASPAPEVYTSRNAHRASRSGH